MATCKPLLCAYTNSIQAVAANAPINLAVNKILSGIGFNHVAGTPTVEITRAGYYYISFDGDITPAADGAVTIQLYKNGEPVADAFTIFNGVTTATQSVHFDTLIKVLPSCKAIDNTTNLQVRSNVAVTVNNASIVMF